MKKLILAVCTILFSITAIAGNLNPVHLSEKNISNADETTIIITLQKGEDEVTQNIVFKSFDALENYDFNEIIATDKCEITTTVTVSVSVSAGLGVSASATLTASAQITVSCDKLKEEVKKLAKTLKDGLT